MTAKPSGPQQIAEMGRLTQQAAAWLTRTGARKLRDDFSVPREADGSYNAQRLVQWALDKLPSLDLSDEDLEQMFRCLEGRESDWSVSAVVKTLQDLRAKHGNRFCIAFFEAFLDDALQHERAVGPVDFLRLKPGSGISETDLMEAQLRRPTYCIECEHVRHGRSWFDRQLKDCERKLYWTGICPECAKRGQT